MRRVGLPIFASSSTRPESHAHDLRVALCFASCFSHCCNLLLCFPAPLHDKNEVSGLSGQWSASVPMPGKKSSHHTSQETEAPLDAAVAPDPSNQDPPKSSQLPRSPPSESTSANGSFLGNIVSVLKLPEQSPAAKPSENVVSPRSLQKKVQNAEGGAASLWDKVRSSTLHMPATINDGLKQRSTDPNEEQYATQQKFMLLIF